MNRVVVASGAKLRRESRPVTRAEMLRLRLSDEIVSGTLEPGEPLDEAELARRFGVSRTPVREAIRNLAASGLVESRPHRGAVVALPAPQRLVDMFRAMAELESLCAGLAAVNMTEFDRTQLRLFHQDMAAIVRSGDTDAYREANDRFHTLVYAGSHNSYLAEMATMTRQRVAPFRRAQFKAPGRLAASHAEHGMVLKAILADGRQAAAEAMLRHLESVQATYRAFSALGVAIA